MANIDTIRLEGRFSLTYRGQTLYPDAGSTWQIKPYLDETALQAAAPPEIKTIVEKRIWADDEGFVVESATPGAGGLVYGDRGVDLENLHSTAITPRIELGRATWKLVPESVTYTIPAALLGVDDDVTVQDAVQASDLLLTPGQVNDLAFVRTLNVGRGELVVSGVPGRGIATDGLTLDGTTLEVAYDDGTTEQIGTLPEADPALIAAAITQEAPGAVQAAIYTERTTKNLYNPADPDVLNNKAPGSASTGGPGSYVDLANYRVSGFIPVQPGQSYVLSLARYYEWFTAAKAPMAVATNVGSNTAITTVTAPGNAAFLRATHRYDTSPNMQVEAGEVATDYEPYFPGVRTSVDAQFAARVAQAARVQPLTVARVGDQITLTRQLEGRALVETMTLTGSQNGGFNLLTTTLGGTLIHGPDDDITPLRTQMGTVGANHGYPNVRAFNNPDAKTDADIGTVWTDGAREYVLLDVDEAAGGVIVMGGSYATDGAGVVTSATVAPAADLTYVSGSTTGKTATIARSPIIVRQLIPASLAKRTVTAYIDDAPLLAGGTRNGNRFTVRETYEIVDYAPLYDQAKTHVGTPLAALALSPCVRVANTFEWTTAGCVVTTELLELKPTVLAQCGSVQSAVMNRAGSTITRYMPGVGTVGGRDLAAGTDLATWNTSVNITPADLTNPARPPVMTLDVVAVGGVPEVGFALGYLPAGRRGDEASRDTQRLARASTRLWDLRNTKKNYPIFTMAEPAGWGVIRTVAYRAYLGPSQIAAVLGARPNPLAANQAFAAAAGVA